MGSATSTTTILGTTNVSVLNSSTIDGTFLKIGSTNAQDIYIGNGSQIKTVVISNTTTTLNASIIIGNTNSTTNLLSNSINIGCQGLTSTGNISIASGTNTTGSNVQVGSNTLTTLNLQAADLRINSNFYDGNTTIGSTTGNGTITINKPLISNYSYPISTPSQIGWMQIKTSSSTLTFNSTAKAYSCNTTALVQGIYDIRAYIFTGSSSFTSGNQLAYFVSSNTAIADGSTTFTDPNNATFGYHYGRIGPIAGDAVNNFSGMINNTGANFYPYWACAVTNSVQPSPSGFGLVQITFTRIA
jgi:hypothetical protein